MHVSQDMHVRLEMDTSQKVVLRAGENHASASKAQAKKDTVSCASASLSLAESAGREQAAKQAGMRQAQGLAVIEPKLSYTMVCDICDREHSGLHHSI